MDGPETLVFLLMTSLFLDIFISFRLLNSTDGGCNRVLLEIFFLYIYILLIEANNLRNKEMWTAGQKKKGTKMFSPVCQKMVGAKSRRMETKKSKPSWTWKNITLFVTAWTRRDIQASDADYKYWWRKGGGREKKKSSARVFSMCLLSVSRNSHMGPKEGLKTYKSNQKKYLQGNWKGVIERQDRCAQTWGDTFPQNFCCPMDPYLDQVFNTQ